MAKWCMFALYNTWRMWKMCKVSSVQFCREQGKTSTHRCETSAVGWEARRDMQGCPWNGFSPWEKPLCPLWPHLHPRVERFRRHPRGQACSSVLLGWLQWGQNGSKGMEQGWKQRAGKALHFCELLTSQAAFRPISERWQEEQLHSFPQEPTAGTSCVS